MLAAPVAMQGVETRGEAAPGFRVAPGTAILSSRRRDCLVSSGRAFVSWIASSMVSWHRGVRVREELPSMRVHGSNRRRAGTILLGRWTTPALLLPLLVRRWAARTLDNVFVRVSLPCWDAGVRLGGVLPNHGHSHYLPGGPGVEVTTETSVLGRGSILEMRAAVCWMCGFLRRSPGSSFLPLQPWAPFLAPPTPRLSSPSVCFSWAGVPAPGCHPVVSASGVSIGQARSLAYWQPGLPGTYRDVRSGSPVSFRCG